LPRLALVAISILLIVRVATLIDSIGFPRAPGGTNSPSSLDAAGNRIAGNKPTLASILVANLFGAPPAVGATAATSQALVLTGTFVFGDPARGGLAVLGEKPEKATVHAVGEEVLPGVVLKQVSTDHVVLERAGVLEFLPIQRLQGSAGSSLFAAAQFDPPGDPELDVPPPIVLNTGIRVGTPAVETSNN
jgi:general secretion pathway protein C